VERVTVFSSWAAQIQDRVSGKGKAKAKAKAKQDGLANEQVYLRELNTMRTFEKSLFWRYDNPV
jgi:hypothetical protein